jgi:hypothetical protein
MKITDGRISASYPRFMSTGRTSAQTAGFSLHAGHIIESPKFVSLFMTST